GCLCWPLPGRGDCRCGSGSFQDRIRVLLQAFSCAYSTQPDEWERVRLPIVNHDPLCVPLWSMTAGLFPDVLLSEPAPRTTFGVHRRTERTRAKVDGTQAGPPGGLAQSWQAAPVAMGPL